MNITRDALCCVWEWLDRPGLESASIRFTDDAVVLDGVAVTVFDATPLRFRYSVLTDSSGQVRDASIQLEWQGATKKARLTRDQFGWTVDEDPRADLAGCIDIDIMGSPSTNTLPVRRFAWVPGEPREFRMAYIRLPDLAVVPMAQRYTFLGGLRTARAAGGQVGPPAHADLRRFEYCSVDSGFRAEITVDEEGVVVDYPPYWRRHKLER
jgi:hypothetical protein